MLTYSPAQRLLSEALGTALLVATVVGSGIMAETLADGNGGVALLANTLATGAILFVLITVLGPVSGAHLNPVISAVFALRRDLHWGAALLFILAQLVGAVAGHAAGAWHVRSALVAVVDPFPRGGRPVAVRGHRHLCSVLTIIGTLRSRPDAVPVAVALAIVAGYWFTASTSFANTAVTIARAFTDSFAGIAAGHVPMFVLSQFAGGLLAWLVAENLFGWQPDEAEPPSLAGRLEQ
jgi:glycerol uptake facilitator-like aquaporin